MQRILLLYNHQKTPENRALQYPYLPKEAWILVALVSLGFPNLKNKSLPFINHERSVDKSISKYFLRILANRTAHYSSAWNIEVSISIILIDDHDVCRLKKDCKDGGKLKVEGNHFEKDTKKENFEKDL